MAAKSRHPEPARPTHRPVFLDADLIDVWEVTARVGTALRNARHAGRACCCAAPPAVVVVMPASAGRPHDTELLLCGHHYRASRQALTAASATAVSMDGMPLAGHSWWPRPARV